MNFPGSPTFAGGLDAFVMKLNSTGTPQYSTFIGGTSDDVGLGIVLQGGNAFIVGSTHGGGFPGTLIGMGGSQDVFVAEFDGSGGRIFSTPVGGTGDDIGEGIAVDGSGNIYIAGETDSTNFPVTLNVFPGHGGRDGFLMKLSSGGSTSLYSTYIGGSGADLATVIALDSSNHAIVSGITQSSNLGTGVSIFSGSDDAFVAAFDTSALTGPASLIYFTYVGGSGADDANGIAVDGTGNVFITGRTSSHSLPSAVDSLSGTQDAFVAKLNASGSIAFTVYLGGSGDSTGDFDEGIGITLDSSGNIYVTGSTNSSDFPTASAIKGGSALQGLNDAFITELNPSGNTKVFSTYFGGMGSEDEALPGTSGLAGAIAVDSSGNIYVTGSTSSSAGLQGPPSNGFGGGPSDAYLLKIGPS